MRHHLLFSFVKAPATETSTFQWGAGGLMPARAAGTR